MKVILIDEVRGLGGRGDVVSVRDGYARNFLLPKQLAREATPGNLKAAELEKKKWAALTEKEKDSAQKLAEQLQGVTVIVHKRVGESGTLFGSVTANELADALESRGFQVDKRRIELGHSIKALGVNEVDVRLHRHVSAHIRVEVVPTVETEYTEVRLPGEEPKVEPAGEQAQASAPAPEPQAEQPSAE
ncbi:MAG TPA: 50S ribosomal protein L9 [Thermoanaerobaculia bacterium]|nr:50S ribosomal protein L9 [Thermoanaerobaculia bacterium]